MTPFATLNFPAAEHLGTQKLDLRSKSSWKSGSRELMSARIGSAKSATQAGRDVGVCVGQDVLDGMIVADGSGVALGEKIVAVGGSVVSVAGAGEMAVSFWSVHPVPKTTMSMIANTPRLAAIFLRESEFWEQPIDCPVRSGIVTSLLR
jgi:hypothetical protein